MHSTQLHLCIDLFSNFFVDLLFFPLCPSSSSSRFQTFRIHIKHPFQTKQSPVVFIMLFKSLAVAAAVGTAVAQRPANMSICDYYTTALLMNNSAANAYTLLTLVVNTAVIGNCKTKPASMLWLRLTSSQTPNQMSASLSQASSPQARTTIRQSTFFHTLMASLLRRTEVEWQEFLSTSSTVVELLL